MWKTRRRPELIEEFQREIYGRTPKAVPKVTWEVAGTTKETVGGVAAVTKQLVGHVDNSAYPAVDGQHPGDADDPGQGDRRAGDHRVRRRRPACARRSSSSAESLRTSRRPRRARRRPAGAERAGARRRTRRRRPVRPGRSSCWPRAGATSNMNTGSIQADCAAGLTSGIIGLVNHGQPRKLDDWGALSAWGWGASRVLDYLQTDKSVDATRVGVQGHSRWGKAALVAMAFDERFAIGYISSSGQGGAKLNRRKYGEVIENLATSFPYWMAGNYVKYTGRWDTLPVDSHELIALCAPRPVFLSAGNGPGPVAADGTFQANDAWADAKGSFLAAVGAGPVYRLLGKKDIGTTEFPPIDTPVIDGDIGFRQHTAGHTPGPTWPTFITSRSGTSRSRPRRTCHTERGVGAPIGALSADRGDTRRRARSRRPSPAPPSAPPRDPRRGSRSTARPPCHPSRTRISRSDTASMMYSRRASSSSAP